jgi:hypothetical protein
MKSDLIRNQIGSKFFMKMTRAKSLKNPQKSIPRPKLSFHKKNVYKKKVRTKTKASLLKSRIGQHY